MNPDAGQRTRRPRWRWLLLVAAGMVAAGAGVVAWALLVWLPGWRPGLRPGERLGVDVSSHQQAIDWQRVAGDGVAFAYIKATEGADFVDPRFADNWRAASAAGVDRGAYHFFTLCASGAAQAHNFLVVARPGDGDLPPAVDLELAGNCASRPPSATVQRELATFLALVERATGRAAVLYVGDDFRDRYPVAALRGHDLWVRHLLRRPSGASWRLWQASAFAHVDGIGGKTDLDVMRTR